MAKVQFLSSFRPTIFYSSSARIVPDLKHEKAPKMKTMKQLSRLDNKEDVFDFSIAV